jgi:hypothetical protein
MTAGFHLTRTHRPNWDKIAKLDIAKRMRIKKVTPEIPVGHHPTTICLDCNGLLNDLDECIYDCTRVRRQRKKHQHDRRAVPAWRPDEMESLQRELDEELDFIENRHNSMGKTLTEDEVDKLGAVILNRPNCPDEDIRSTTSEQNCVSPFTPLRVNNETYPFTPILPLHCPKY